MSVDSSQLGPLPSPEVPTVSEAVTVASSDSAWLTDGSEQKLHPNYIPCERLVGWIVVGVLGFLIILGVGLLFWLNDWPALAFVIIGVLALVILGGLCWLAHFWPAIEYRYRSYRVSATGVQILKGVLWRSVMDVPKSRVQHTDVNQGPIERKFGLAHLVIHTAGTISASVKLEGLGHETAVAIRDHLMESDSGDAV